MKHWKAMVVSVAVLAMAGVAAAQGAEDRGALIIREDACLLLDGNGNAVLVPANVQAVVTPSGNASVKCTAQGVTPSADGRTKVFTFADLGIECGVVDTPTGPVFTQNYLMVITHSGIANLSCEFNAHR
jgi:hypothetical protein